LEDPWTRIFRDCSTKVWKTLELGFSETLERPLRDPWTRNVRDRSTKVWKTLELGFSETLERPDNHPSSALSITFHYLAKLGSRGLKRGIFIDIEK